MLLLSWIAPGGGRGIVTLDLLNCNEVRSVPSPAHPSARDDIGTVAARMQVAAENEENRAAEMEMDLVEMLCPFQLMYSDGIERLGAESARERVRWVSAIWCVGFRLCYSCRRVTNYLNSVGKHLTDLLHCQTAHRRVHQLAQSAPFGP